MRKSTANRMDNLSAHFFSDFGVRIAEMKAAGYDIVRMDAGSPDLPPPQHIVDALTRSVNSADHHGYQPHHGSDQLRMAWAALYRREFDVRIDPETEILPLMGSKEGIFHLSQAYIEPGDVVLAPDPSYVTYGRGAIFSGGEVYAMPLLSENGFLPDLEAIPETILQRTKLMWLNYPNNPTASVAGLDFFSQAVEFARRYGFWLCHDAAYTRVTFDQVSAPSILQAPGAKEVAVEFNSLSKSHNMAGWRIGALVGHSDVVKALYRLKTNIDSGHFKPILDAAVAAMTGDQSWTRERNKIYAQRRDLVVSALRDMGMDAQTPTASMYVWSPVPHGWDCEAFVYAALEHAHISMTPGTVFGDAGAGYVRIALTASQERIKAAFERMKEWIG